MTLADRVPRYLPISGGPISVLDIIRRIAPILPSQVPGVSGNLSTGTRGPTKTDTRLAIGLQLKYVVFDYQCFDDLIAMAKEKLELDGLPLDPTSIPHQRWMCKVDYAETTMFLPQEVHSENDIVSWSFSSVVRPALVVAAHLLDKSLAPSFTATYPNLTSSNGPKHIPDGIIWDEERLAVLTIELKTPAALEEAFSDTEILPAWINMPRGRAMRFTWPESINMHDKDCRILVQIWQQMREYNVDCAILSSFEATYLFFKQGDDTLFMSKKYERIHSPLLVTFAHIALSLGLIEKQKFIEKLPEVSKNWGSRGLWTSEDRPPGLDPKTYPITYRPMWLK
ncbi:hypothetical protein Hypma_001882 [Hypsizygus marmoreus]|uniref:Uncharacterized protein n=1 Tax=Hypsizygus marmoreus TaxID=39966 RepID=A0A369J9M3_HYPMA|nr:hypothetical protein Hypma_001882 [Hypsizygus marmoreus]